MTRDGEGAGHYLCDVKCKESQNWFRTNDNNDPVLITVDNVTRNAVVILYQKK